jgi:hypothetical protein
MFYVRLGEHQENTTGKPLANSYKKYWVRQQDVLCIYTLKSRYSSNQEMRQASTSACPLNHIQKVNYMGP